MCLLEERGIKGQPVQGAVRPELKLRGVNISRQQPARTRATATMSRSPERMSSYRRHFEDGMTSSFQVRVSSPSPPRVRHRSASYSRSAVATTMRADSMGRRTFSGTRRSHLTSARSMGALCLGVGMGATLDLDAAAAENQAFLSTRTTERQEMVVLNDRLAAYIEKVRTLEQQNKLLETEIAALQNRYVKPSGLRMLYEEQLRELKRIADQMLVQRNIAIAAKEAMAAQLEMLKAKYEEAVEARKKAEQEIEAFRPDVDAATSARIALEKQLENLEAELLFLQRVQKEEIEELMKQIYGAVAKTEVSFSLPDLAAALKLIQSQYDEIAAKNLQEMDAWYKTKFEDLSNASTKHVERVRSVREEMATCKKDIQSKERELEALKTRNETLEIQIREALEKYKKEEEDLKARIEALTVELKSIKGKIALHLREYQDLLNIKMALEIEITTYRKLIEGEDLRLSSMVRNLSLMSSSMSTTSAMSATATMSTASAMSAASAMNSMAAGSSMASDSSVVAGSSTVAGNSTVAASTTAAESSTATASSAEAVNGGLGGGLGGGVESDLGGGLESTLGGNPGNGTEGSTLDSQLEATESISSEQAVEMTERKTVLIS
ncbi:notochord granular surface isoform X2 [Anguilla anguilla]|uniref:notochord granular surface isoform X2 n=1 Tax=Anguilla anguilla TaxID=7936 RepID=UPI0015B126EB|nr:notochord granular surface isoform X2 [Anguilla anguilla]